MDDSGDILKRFEYLPYGETWFEEGEFAHAPKYNSQELDEETNFYFYNARHYDPQIGRFVTADNIIDGEDDSQGWNRYSYVSGNPILYKDPTGHWHLLSELIQAGLSDDAKDSGDQYLEYKKGVAQSFKNTGKVLESSAKLLTDPEYRLETSEAISNKVKKEIKDVSENGIKNYAKKKVVSAKKAATKVINNAMENPAKAVGLVAGTAAQTWAAGRLLIPAKGGTTSTKEVLEKLRRKAVKDAWEQEKKLVDLTGRGTRRWSNAQKAELLKKGKVKGFEGHHIKSVKSKPKYVGKADNIEFVIRKEHLQRHGGNFKNKTTGKFIKREKLLKKWKE